MRIATKAFLATLLIETCVLYVFLSRTPEVSFKSTDYISCDEYGYSDGSGPVTVQFQIGTADKRIVIIKTEVDSWKRANAICVSWNNIGYELAK